MEAIYPVCGAGGPQLKRNPLGGARPISATSVHVTMQAFARLGYSVQYPDPIRVPAGAPVTVVRRDDQFTHWLWCRATDGREGWVPEPILSSTEPGPATVSEPYAATELPLSAGEVVDVLRQFDGFGFGQRDDGRIGWFPLSILDQGSPQPGAT